MGWAQRANQRAQDKQIGLLAPKPSKARPIRALDRPSLAAMIREFCGLDHRAQPAPAVAQAENEPLVPRREKVS